MQPVRSEMLCVEAAYSTNEFGSIWPEGCGARRGKKRGEVSVEQGNMNVGMGNFSVEMWDFE